MARHASRLSRSEHRELRTLWDEYMPAELIAQRIHMSPQFVRDYAATYDFPKRDLIKLRKARMEIFRVKTSYTCIVDDYPEELDRDAEDIVDVYHMAVGYKTLEQIQFAMRDRRSTEWVSREYKRVIDMAMKQRKYLEKEDAEANKWEVAVMSLRACVFGARRKIDKVGRYSGQDN